MILGTLSLFQKRGIFYKEHQLTSEDKFSAMIDSALTPDEELTLSDVPKKHQITPVAESGTTDYINAIFEDEGKAEYPYEVTIWLLVEALPEETHNGHLK